MTMDIMRTILAVLTVTFVGFNILYLVTLRRGGLSAAEKIALSYGIGLGFLSFEMMLFYYFKRDFSLARILLPWLPLVALNAVLFLESSRKGAFGHAEKKDKPSRGGFLRNFLVFGISFEIIYVFFRALIKPIESYDAIAIYAIKSKIFYMAGCIPQDFFQRLSPLFPHPDYPLNVQLSETLVYLFMGNLNDHIVKLIFPLYFLGILALLYYGIRRFAARTYALVFTFILASIPQFNAYAANAYIDLVLSYYYFASALFLLVWFRDPKETQFLALSAVMVALSAWTKNEGLLYCVVNFFILLIYSFSENKGRLREKILDILIYAGIILAMTFVWQYTKAAKGLFNIDIGAIDASPANLIRQSYKLGSIAYEFQKQIMGPKKWNILWIALFVILIVNRKKIMKGASGYIALSLLLAISGYIFIYLVAALEINYFLRTTWSRFLIHFLPITVYLLADLLKEDVDI